MITRSSSPIGNLSSRTVSVRDNPIPFLHYEEVALSNHFKFKTELFKTGEKYLFNLKEFKIFFRNF